MEKEALALTWACERFGDLNIGLHFELETAHKPLVSLLGGQALDSLPPRTQRFRMRLMRYWYTIVHVPGKSPTTADTLSRALLKDVAMADNSSETQEHAAGVDRQDTSKDTGQVSPEWLQGTPQSVRSRSGRSITKPDCLDL